MKFSIVVFALTAIALFGGGHAAWFCALSHSPWVLPLMRGGG
jgi:hypothetical protein